MTASQRTKGAVYERSFVRWLNGNGWPFAERRIAGMGEDKGDVTGMGPVTFDCKNHKTLSLGSWCDQLEQEMKCAGTHVGAVIVKRKGNVDPGSDFAVMPVRILAGLLKEAGY